MASITVTPLRIPDVLLISAPRFGDARGFFSETYSVKAFHAAEIKLTFVQDNHSRSAAVGTVRGLHYQSPPFAQDKLVRVTRGRILDVAVDIRRSSPTFGQHVSVEISAAAWNQVLVPVGFAHGFVTLEPDTEVLYKVTNDYAPGHDHGILWSDPMLGIAWPIADTAATLSDKDRHHPHLADATVLFP
jgi:dTDP-4-dehydrorhamnose 3,5-epimerase